MLEAGLLDHDDNLELLGGELIDRPSEGELHLTLKAMLVRWLIRNLSDSWLVVPDSPLHLSAITAPEPDAYVAVDGTALEPVDPTQVPLVIEVADTSLTHDLNRKPAVYAAFGLTEYWVVDANGRRTYVFRGPANGSYPDPTPVAFDQPLTPAAFPDLSLTIGDLLKSA